MTNLTVGRSHNARPSRRQRYGAVILPLCNRVNLITCLFPVGFCDENQLIYMLENVFAPLLVVMLLSESWWSRIWQLLHRTCALCVVSLQIFRYGSIVILSLLELHILLLLVCMHEWMTFFFGIWKDMLICWCWICPIARHICALSTELWSD